MIHLTPPCLAGTRTASATLELGSSCFAVSSGSILRRCCDLVACRVFAGGDREWYAEQPSRLRRPALQGDRASGPVAPPRRHPAPHTSPSPNLPRPPAARRAAATHHRIVRHPHAAAAIRHVSQRHATRCRSAAVARATITPDHVREIPPPVFVQASSAEATALAFAEALTETTGCLMCNIQDRFSRCFGCRRFTVQTC